MSDSTFFDRMDELSRQVGKGDLHGSVTFDQVYARYAGGIGDEGDDTGVITPTQISHGPHGKPGPSFNHPRGGEADYLGGPLTEKGPEYAQRLADSIGDEVPMDSKMIELTEDLAMTASARAPIEFWLLTGSAHPIVKSDGHTIYDRPPVVPRAPETLLKALARTAEGDVKHANGDSRRSSPLTPSIVNLFGGGKVVAAP